mgnify:CR=1 FL=1
MQYKLLALDMDGTTLNSEKKITPKTANAISELGNCNIAVVLSTGRGLAELADYKTELKFMHYGILVSGGMVYDFFNSKPVITHPLDTEIILQLIDGAVAENAMIQLLTETASVTREEDILNMETFGMGIYQDMYYRNCVRCDDFKKFIRENPGKILKLNIYHRSTESRGKNFKRFEKFNLAIDYAEKTALEITPKNISKASGLKELCNFLKINLSETVAVGDAENDIEILKTAGLGVAMGNASEKIKNLADFVTDDNDHDGIVKVIEKFF